MGACWTGGGARGAGRKTARERGDRSLDKSGRLFSCCSMSPSLQSAASRRKRRRHAGWSVESDSSTPSRTGSFVSTCTLARSDALLARWIGKDVRKGTTSLLHRVTLLAPPESSGRTHDGDAVQPRSLSAKSLGTSSLYFGANLVLDRSGIYDSHGTAHERGTAFARRCFSCALNLGGALVLVRALPNFTLSSCHTVWEAQEGKSDSSQTLRRCFALREVAREPDLRAV